MAAKAIISEIRGDPSPAPYDGAGSCYVEFGGELVARVDVNFLSGPKPTGKYTPPSETIVAEKAHFGSSRVARWFGTAAGR